MKYTFVIFILCINPLFSQDWEMKLDTMRLENLRKNVYESIFKEYEDQSSKAKNCSPFDSEAINLLDVCLEKLKVEYTNDTIAKYIKDLDFKKEIIQEVLRSNSKKGIFTLYIINFARSKYDTFTGYDYILIAENLDSWNIFNVSKEVKNNFKKRVKKNEFFWNFEYFFNTIKTKSDYTKRCFAGVHSITITKIYKEKMDDTFLSFKSAINLIPACQEESFLEYILGFKNHLNPQKYK